MILFFCVFFVLVRKDTALGIPANATYLTRVLAFVKDVFERPPALWYTPIYGTMLGLWRDGRPVPGDDDVDLYVRYEDKAEIMRRILEATYGRLADHSPLSAQANETYYRFTSWLFIAQPTLERGQLEFWLAANATKKSQDGSDLLCEFKWLDHFHTLSDDASVLVHPSNMPFPFHIMEKSLWITAGIYFETFYIPSDSKGNWVELDTMDELCGDYHNPANIRPAESNPVAEEEFLFCERNAFKFPWAYSLFNRNVGSRSEYVALREPGKLFMKKTWDIAGHQAGRDVSGYEEMADLVSQFARAFPPQHFDYWVDGWDAVTLIDSVRSTPLASTFPDKLPSVIIVFPLVSWQAVESVLGRWVSMEDEITSLCATVKFCKYLPVSRNSQDLLFVRGASQRSSLLYAVSLSGVSIPIYISDGMRSENVVYSETSEPFVQEEERRLWTRASHIKEESIAGVKVPISLRMIGGPHDGFEVQDTFVADRYNHKCEVVKCLVGEKELLEEGEDFLVFDTTWNSNYHRSYSLSKAISGAAYFSLSDKCRKLWFDSDRYAEHPKRLLFNGRMNVTLGPQESLDLDALKADYNFYMTLWLILKISAAILIFLGVALKIAGVNVQKLKRFRSIVVNWKRKKGVEAE